jgi:ornithine--oxo-acid transaminase
MTTAIGTDEALGRHLSLAEAHLAANYNPLPVVIESGQGAWVKDTAGRRYLDCLAAYSAVNFGHGNPAILSAARGQLEFITLTSRAFHNDQLGPFAAELAALSDKDMILPMNTGAEAVETAIKVARKWGYEVKGVQPDRATILVASNNFHGRTTTIVGFSDDPDARTGFGPYAPGFRTVAYGSIEAFAAAIDETTVAVLLEPVQGEAGVIVPPAEYLPGVRQLCDQHGVLLIADEIQSGLGRTGTTFACDLTGTTPDIYILGKALGGGVVPVSAIAANRDVLSVIRPGQHGSTFGGNPLGAAVGRAVIQLLATGEPQQRAAELGIVLHRQLSGLIGRGVTAIRVAGLWAGIDIDPTYGSGRQVCEKLLQRGILAKDTHGSTIRLAPPLVITDSELTWAVRELANALDELSGR